MRASFAVPGDLSARTGGYGYARRLLAKAPAAGLELDLVALPGGFPSPDRAAVTETLELLDAARAPVLVDGLALGAMPADGLAGLAKPLVALCHHPLGHETGLPAERAAALIETERAALACCARVITTSRTTAETLIADFGVAEPRISVAPPGTDPAPRAGGSGGPGVEILSVGTVSPRKGFLDLIAALEPLAQRAWFLTIAGSTDRDPAAADALRDAIERAGLMRRVRLAGELEEEALARAYGASDLFALASHYEGFGMAFTEALARGLPVVGYAAGAVPEATASGGARLAPVGDVAALSEALSELIGDPEIRSKQAAEAWAGESRLTRWPDTARAVAAALKEAI